MPQYKLTDLGINALAMGRFSKQSCTNTEYHGEWYEMLIPIGKNHSMKLRVDGDCIRENPDWFRVA